jgi:hypothetical protein
MKKFGLAIVLVASSSFAHQQNVTPKQEKTYLNPSHVHIGSEGLFVFVNNHWIQTSRLESDGSGIFIDSNEFMPWICDRCGRATTGWWACEHCSNPK